MGLPAWLVWVFVHLMYLVQFQAPGGCVRAVGIRVPDLQPRGAPDYRRQPHRGIGRRLQLGELSRRDTAQPNSSLWEPSRVQVSDGEMLCRCDTLPHRSRLRSESRASASGFAMAQFMPSKTYPWCIRVGLAVDQE